MQSTGNICVVVKLRLLDRWSNTRTRGQMENRVEFLVSKNITNFVGVPKIDIVQSNVFRERGNVLSLDLWIVEIVEVVDDGDVMPIAEKPFDQMRADESCTAGHENFHWSGTSTTKDTKCTKKIRLFSAAPFSVTPLA